MAAGLVLQIKAGVNEKVPLFSCVQIRLLVSISVQRCFSILETGTRGTTRPCQTTGLCVCIHPIACCLEELHGLWLDRSASHGFLGLLGADGSFLLLCARAFRKGGKVGQVQYREWPLLRHMMSVASRRHCWAMVQTPCCSKSTASWPEGEFSINQN